MFSFDHRWQSSVGGTYPAGIPIDQEVVRVPGTDGIYVGAGCEAGTGERKKFLGYTDRSGIMRRNKFISGTKEEW